MRTIMGFITENVAKIKFQLPSGVMLVAATKTQDAGAVREAISAGVDACGENRVQELVSKNALGAYEGAPLHFIGHLQKNKLKQVVGICELIESVDSVELLHLIDARAKQLGIVQNVLLEINIAREATKTGMLPEDLPQILDSAADLDGIYVKGLMAIPPISTVEGANSRFFAHMYQLFVDIGAKKYDNISMGLLSMGMSGDYMDAVREGANSVRVGSSIFGQRKY